MKKILFIIALLFPCLKAPAKPEYTLQIKTNRCTTCHASPVGGGHRNITGKAFGPKSAPLESFSQQDLFGLDWRAMAYTPVKKEIEKNRNGMAIMAVLPSVSIPFFKNSNGREWRFVHSHNIGGFSNPITPENFRDSYLRIKLYDDYRIFPQFITIGRFSAPFGLLTDEHRTYIRQQTKTTWNDREMGILFSGDWSHNVHYDLALVNGEQIAGRGFNTGQLLQWGGIANIRYLALWGWMAGVSASYYNNEKYSSALSVYQVLSMDSLTKDRLPGVLIAEAVFGYKTNHYLASFFSDTARYSKEVEDSASLGYLVQWNYNFLPAWKFIFKYDQLFPDVSYRKTQEDNYNFKDYYQRFGLGLRYFFNNQTLLDLRYEKAIATPLSEKQAEQEGKTGLAAQDAIWLLLQVKL